MSVIRSFARRALAPVLAPVLAAGLALPLGASAVAEAITFDFKDPKGVNGVVFVLDSKLEPIVGHGSGIAGEVTYDPADPAAIAGTITLSAEGLSTSNDRMTQVMHTADWLGVSDVPLVTFTMKSAEVAESDVDGAVKLDVTGDLSLAGMTKAISVPVYATLLEDMAKNRGGADSGHLLALRSTMVIDRTDFGIKPDMGGDVVAETVVIEIPIVGYSK
ncbi:MAG: YceI family protein [Planctomycetota bacterium]